MSEPATTALPDELRDKLALVLDVDDLDHVELIAADVTAGF